MLSMNRDEFLSELERLLAGLSVQEREEALRYYRDYFDDAGEEREAEVLQDPGAPRKAAAAVMGQFETDDGEFTEKGFENPRWKEPPKEVIVVEDQEGRRRKWIKAGIFIFFILFILPAVFKLLGISVIALLALLGLLLGVGVCTAVSIVAGVAVVAAGLGFLFWAPMKGLAVLGAGCLLLGTGFLGNVLCMRFYGRWLPALLRAASEQVGKLGKKRRGEMKE